MKKYNLLTIMTLTLVMYGSSLLVNHCYAQAANAANSAENKEILLTQTKSDNTSESNSSNSMPVISSGLDGYPYIAVVAGEDVYVRSGPATPYYPVCKLKKGQEVIVTLERPGKKNWSRVEPVPGTIAYIATEYVKLLDVNAINGAASAGVDLLGREIITGIVTGDNVRVRAGSVDITPENAYRVLMLAQNGQQVDIVGKTGDFYKIVPPKGSYFWVCSDFLKKKDTSNSLDINVLRDQTDKQMKDVVEPGELKGNYVTLKGILDKYEAIQAISLMDRDYTALKAEITQLAEETDSPSVKNTAQVLIENIVRGENAQKQVAASIEQDKKIEEAMDKIDQAVVKALKEMSPASSSPDVIVAKGKLAESAVFSSGVSKRYILMDSKGVITCYVSGDNLEPYVGKFISVSGPASYNPFGKTRIIEAVKVVELDSLE